MRKYSNSERFLDLLQIDVNKTSVIAVVGGGGKTSLINRLTEELVQEGKRVIIATTTHMFYEIERPFAANGERELILENLENFGYTVTGSWEVGNSKIGSLPEKFLQSLCEFCDVMFIEADGAKRLPIKIPASWEPVIPLFTDLVIGVVGLDCYGKVIDKTAHRAVLTAEFLQKRISDEITDNDIIKIASSDMGLRKTVEERQYRVYLNKADVLNMDLPEKIVEKLSEKNVIAVYGSLKEG